MDSHTAQLAKQGEKVTKVTAYINSSDLLFKGVFLGHNWNTICNWTQQNGLHSEDGAGFFYINRATDTGGEFTPLEPQEMQDIVNTILDETSVDTLKVIED